MPFGLRGGATCHLGSWRQGLILFPRSERVKSDPRSIDTLSAPFPAVLLLESCVYAVEKCECSRGPKTAVHFAGKVLDLNGEGRLPDANAVAGVDQSEPRACALW